MRALARFGGFAGCALDRPIQNHLILGSLGDDAKPVAGSTSETEQFGNEPPCSCPSGDRHCLKFS